MNVLYLIKAGGLYTMVDTGTALIVSSFVGLIGAIIILSLSNRNWFKKQVFKTNLSLDKSVNKIKLDQLRKELKVGSSEGAKSGLDLAGIIEGLTGNEEEENPVIDIISRVIDSNPELVEGLISRFGPDLVKKYLTPEQQQKYL